MRILVIDDDQEVRSELRLKLEAAGYEVNEAADGIEGEEKCIASDPDLVITELIMPRREGIETILAIKKERPETKIIAMSGGGRVDPNDYLKMAERLGADRGIHKPIALDNLLEVIRELVPAASSIQSKA